MIKFDLEKAKAGAGVQTQNDRYKVRLLCFDVNRVGNEILGLVEICGNECAFFWNLEGKSFDETLNLEMQREKKYTCELLCEFDEENNILYCNNTLFVFNKDKSKLTTVVLPQTVTIHIEE